MDELRSISPEIAEEIAAYYRDLPDTTAFLDMVTPANMAHKVAANHPNLDTSFYRMVEAAAREAFNARMGWTEAKPVVLPSIPALAGLINSKDSSWF